MGTCHIICHDVFGVQYQYPIFDIVCCTNTHNFIHSLIYKYKKNRGLGDVRETSREVSFCAHAIVSKEDVFIVPDTYEDPRFKENGLVTGPPFIRFYAGVSLVTPNGYKLGTFCIIDRTPRPMGLSLSEKQNLRELTEMVMDTMVHRKQEMEHLMDEKTRIIACAAHDLCK